MASFDTEFSWRYALLMCLCMPCILLVNVSKKIEERRDAKIDAPVSGLSPVRKRALSVHEVVEERKPRFFKPKDKSCLFLEKLPVEIRRMIYIYALGGRVFRIARKNGRLGHITCPHELDQSCGDDCTMYGAHGGNTWPRRKTKRGIDPDAELLGLVKTCRSIYREAIDVLYAHNAFIIAGWLTMNEFPSTILSQRFMSIQTVRLTFDIRDVTDDSPGWDSFWDLIASMERLKTLRIDWGGRYQNGACTEEELRLLASFSKVTKPNFLEVHTFQGDRFDPRDELVGFSLGAE